MRKIIWGLKQLIPMTYRSHYYHGQKRKFCVWKMWLGKCFQIEEYTIK